MTKLKPRASGLIGRINKMIRQDKKYPEVNRALEMLNKRGRRAQYVKDFLPSPDRPGAACCWYNYHPHDQSSAFLGGGTYGQVYMVKSNSRSDQEESSGEPIRACKVQPKSSLEGNPTKIKHLMVEAAVLLLAARNKAPALNKLAPIGKRVVADAPSEVDDFAVFHTDSEIFFVLEMPRYSLPPVGVAPVPEHEELSVLQNQYLHLLAKYYPQGLDRVSSFVQSHFNCRKTLGDDGFYERATKLLPRVKEIKKKNPYLAESKITQPHGSLIDLVWSYCWHGEWDPTPLPELKVKLIIRQCLTAVAWLHSKGIVHRDVKVDNVLFGETRVASPIIDDATSNIIGTTVTETLDIQLLDYGLGKIISKPLDSVKNQGESGCFVDDEDEGEVPQRDPAIAVRRPITLDANTDIYAPIEVIIAERDVLAEQSEKNRKWLSTDPNLKKMDVYGCGIILFLLTHGYSPFLVNQEHLEGLSPQERREVLIQKMLDGPQFSAKVSLECQNFILKLMNNSVSDRLSTKEALEDDYLRDVYCDDPSKTLCSFSYTTWLNGNITDEKISYLSPSELHQVESEKHSSAARGATSSPSSDAAAALEPEISLEDISDGLALLRHLDELPTNEDDDDDDEDTVAMTNQRTVSPSSPGSLGEGIAEALRDREDDGDHEGKIAQ